MIALITILVLGVLILISLRIAYLINLLKQEWVFIELTPSSQANKSRGSNSATVLGVAWSA